MYRVICTKNTCKEVRYMKYILECTYTLEYPVYKIINFK